jgi:hypothetical protein
MVIHIKPSIMQKLFIAISFLLILTSFTAVQSYVYICKGPESKVYHKSDRCKGLSHCSTKVYKVTQEEAKGMNRRACKIEF